MALQCNDNKFDNSDDASWDGEQQDSDSDVRQLIPLYRDILLGFLNQHSADLIPVELNQESLLIKRQQCVTQKIVTPTLIASSWDRIYVQALVAPMVSAGMPLYQVASHLLLSALKEASTSAHEYGDVVKTCTSDSRKRCHMDPATAVRIKELQPPETVMDVAAALWKLKQAPPTPNPKRTTAAAAACTEPLCAATPAPPSVGETGMPAASVCLRQGPTKAQKQRRKRGTQNFSLKLLRQISLRVLAELCACDANDSNSDHPGLPCITSTQLIRALQVGARHLQYS